MIIEQFLIGKMRVFTYLIGCEETGEALVVDPAGDVDRIVAAAEQRKLQIRYIFNTHSHIDHVLGNRSLKQRTGASIIIHKKDRRSLINPLSFTRVALRTFVGSPKPDIVIHRNQSFPVGNLSLQLIHTPGHTPGGMCILCKGNLFTGDTLFVGDSGTTVLPGGNRKTLGRTLKHLMTTLDQDTVVWPGHHYGPMTHSTIRWERSNNVNAKEYGYYIDDEI